MSITDKLRKYVEKAKSGISPICEKNILAIADRIDAEYETTVKRAAQLLADAEKDRDENYANWQDCKQKVLHHAITIDELAAEIERLEVELAQRIGPPKDADGVPIRIGDVVTVDVLWGGRSNPLVVDRMELSHGKDGELWCIALDTDKECWNQPSLIHHYRAPTVEDVLREFAHAILNQKPEFREENIAEYAAKLRLTGEDA